jgi:hypothetical protein
MGNSSKLTYEFEYKDREGDTFQSEQHLTKRDAMKEWRDIQEWNDGDCNITETWIYRGNDFVGRWNW